MRSIFVLLILVMIGLNGKGQSVTALPDSVLSQCCLEVTLLNGNVTTVDWVFIQYITRDGTGTKLFVEYAPNFGGIQWETQIRIQDDFDDVVARSKFIVILFTVGTTDYGINRNWIANIEENTTTGGTWIYGRFGTPTKRKFSAVEDYETMKDLLLACRPRAIAVAENGLYTDGDTVRMGGFLIENTSITTEGYNWQMKDTLSNVEFGLDYLTPETGDTTVYWARRSGSIRQMVQLGRRYYYNSMRDTTGGLYSDLTHSWNAGDPFLQYQIFNPLNPNSGTAWLNIQKDNGFLVMSNETANPYYTSSFSMTNSNVQIGVNESGSGDPGNGVGMGAYGFGTTEYLYMITKGVDDNTATTGQFLQLIDETSGEVDFATIDPVDSSLYATRYWTNSNFFPLQGGTLTGTGGAGFVGFPSQVSAPGTPASGLNVYAQGSSFNWKGTDGYERQFASTLTGGRTYTLPNVSGTFALGTGTSDRSARWSATNTLAAGNFTDNGTKVQALLPFQFQTYTAAGLPTGVTGYHVYNTTTNGPGWYQGSRWAYGLESTFNRGTATYIPFFDANGQLAESTLSSQGLRYYLSGSNYIFEAKTSILAQAQTGGNADIAVRSGSGNGYWSFNTLESNGSFNFYDAASNQFPVTISKGVGSARLEILTTRTNINSSALLESVATKTKLRNTNDSMMVGTGLADALGANLAIWKAQSGSTILSFSKSGTEPFLGIANGTQRGFFQTSTSDGVRIGSITNHPFILYTNSAAKVYLTGTGRLGIAKSAPDYIFDVTSTDAFGLPRGTVAQRPTIASNTTPIRFSIDSFAIEYGESVGVWRLVATRAYARSMKDGNGIISALPSGDVTINAFSNADFKINNLDTAKFGNLILRGRSNSLLVINPNVGSAGTVTEGAGFHTNLNGTINGTDGGTAQIVLGGTVTANTTGSIFGMSLGYASNVTSSAYGLGVGYNADVTADNGAAFGRNALADEIGEMSLGSSIYSKINLWTNSGDIYAKGDVIAEDSIKVTTRPSMPSATDIAVYDSNGWLGYRSASTLPNVYTASDSIRGDRYLEMANDGSAATAIGNWPNFPSRFYVSGEFGLFINPDYGEVSLVNNRAAIGAFGSGTATLESYDTDFSIGSKVAAGTQGVLLEAYKDIATGYVKERIGTTGHFVDISGIGAYQLLPLSTPSTTSSAKTVLQWTGDGSNANPAFVEVKRDTTVYIVDTDLDWSAAITTAQIASRYNRVIFLMTTTSAAGSNSDLTLHTPDVNLMQVEYLIRSTDEAGGFTNTIQFGSNNAVDSGNTLVGTYTPAPGQGVGIRAGLRSGVYKYFYY